MGSVIGIASTRVSDTFIRQRAISQILANQAALLRLQTQLNTGRRFQMPSEDPAAASRIITLQRLLEQKGQVQTNLRTGQSYLTATDTALSTVADSLNEARSVALGAVSTTVSDQQREAAAMQVDQTIGRLLDVGNQQFRGRYLFAGSNTALQPFETTGSNLVQYRGDEGRLSSYSDVDMLFDTNFHGSEVFGAISQPVRGTVDLDPDLTSDTRLADLRGGLGITPGSVAVSDGSTTSIVDLSAAETIGDVVAMLRAGCGAMVLDVVVTSVGLEIVGAPATLLTVREVAGGTTAGELGIIASTPINTVVGDDLDPLLRLTTSLADLPSLTDIASGLQIVNGGTTHVLSFAGAETVEDVLNVFNGSAAGVLAAINESGTGIDVRSRLSGADFMIGENGGATASQLGLRTFTNQTRLEDLNFGGGVIDRDGTDFTITRSDGAVIDVDVAGLETVGDVLTLINGLGGGTLQARLALYGNGIELVDQAAGAGTLTVTRTFPSLAAIELGLVPKGQQSSTGVISGGAQILTGSDVNPLETDGIFTALSRLYVALKENDVLGIQRAVGLLDRQAAAMNFSRAELGARQQTLENLQTRLESENVDLQAALSEEFDADLVKVISDYTARQIAFEASLKSSAGTLQMTLLDYL